MFLYVKWLDFRSPLYVVSHTVGIWIMEAESPNQIITCLLFKWSFGIWMGFKLRTKLSAIHIQIWIKDYLAIKLKPMTWIRDPHWTGNLFKRDFLGFWEPPMPTLIRPLKTCPVFRSYSIIGQLSAIQIPAKSGTVKIWNPDPFRFWMVPKRVVGFWMGSEILKSNLLKSGQMAANLQKVRSLNVFRSGMVGFQISTEYSYCNFII